MAYSTLIREHLLHGSRSTDAAMAFGGDEYPMQRIYSATAVSGHSPDFHDENEYTQDEVEIARFGKKQQLRVRLLASMPFPSSLLELLMD